MKYKSILFFTTTITLVGATLAMDGLAKDANAVSSSEFQLTRADYADRAHAAWIAQIIGVELGLAHEHRKASVEWLDEIAKGRDHGWVDDDWYYEMSALRAFEKYGPEMTVQQLGEQWQKDVCGTWGSSREARLLMERGIQPPDTGHPRYNHSWWTIGPQFSAEIYGLLAPAQPNFAARLARGFGHINGYAEGVDGAVFVAGMVSLGFVECDPQVIVRKAATLIHPESPYRKCIDEIIAMADAGKTFEEIERSVIERWSMVYPGTNNAVPNGGCIALSLWFGESDFLKTINLACSVTDYTDADCNAAGAAAVLGAMHGLKGIPQNLVAPWNDRIQGDKMGELPLPPVDESISALGRRTAAFGEKMLLAHGAKLDGDTLLIVPEVPQTQPLERFTLADLTQYWQPEWKLERAGFGSTIGGLGAYGGTWLADDGLVTWPANVIRGLVLTRKLKLPAGTPHLVAKVAADPGRAWELSVFVNNMELLKQNVVGVPKGIEWQTMDIDLSAYAGREVTLRLYQNIETLKPTHPPSVARWKSVTVQ